MEHRGTARSRIVSVRFDGREIAPETAISAGGRSIGRILSTIDGRGLALMRLDRAEAARAAGEEFLAGDMAIAVERPEWARYRVMGDA
jgi:folate-binding Fe-S cluster repair protein YgfZ